MKNQSNKTRFLQLSPLMRAMGFGVLISMTAVGGVALGAEGHEHKAESAKGQVSQEQAHDKEREQGDEAALGGEEAHGGELVLSEEQRQIGRAHV